MAKNIPEIKHLKSRSGMKISNHDYNDQNDTHSEIILHSSMLKTSQHFEIASHPFRFQCLLVDAGQYLLCFFKAWQSNTGLMIIIN